MLDLHWNFSAQRRSGTQEESQREKKKTLCTPRFRVGLRFSLHEVECPQCDCPLQGGGGGVSPSWTLICSRCCLDVTRKAYPSPPSPPTRQLFISGNILPKSQLGEKRSTESTRQNAEPHFRALIKISLFFSVVSEAAQKTPFICFWCWVQFFVREEWWERLCTFLVFFCVLHVVRTGEDSVQCWQEIVTAITDKA